MKKILLIFLFINFNSYALSSVKENIIKSLKITNNLSFNFEQNINGKIEKGNCIIEYPKKIYCKYDNLNGKILVSNGKSLVIKTKNGIYYRYAIKRKFLINQIQSLKQRVIDDRFINFTIFKDENEINVFFDIKNFDLIGWQTLDIYQNLNITYLSFLKKNQILKKSIFKLPSLN